MLRDNTEPSRETGVETRHRKIKMRVFKKGQPNPYHKKSVEARRLKGGYAIPWNKGLTKETHPSLLSASIKQSGENNSIFHNPNWKKHIMENGLKTRELYRGSRDNKSPRWVRQFGVNQDRTMLKRCNNTCESCKLIKHTKEKPLESDHVIALKLGGQTKISNGQMLCHDCHVIKTREDKRLIREKFNQGIVRTLQ